MKKIKKLKIVREFDEYDCIIESEELYDKDKCIYSVHSLTDCPEDAIIERDLFSAEEYVDAVRYGMNLYANGYDDVEIEE